ncbi:MAG: hypothetical protein L3J22_00890 [Xanthomonadales bacterium]|nr:hypothetical protein [Xanthomonadales bacterium]
MGFLIPLKRKFRKCFLPAESARIAHVINPFKCQQDHPSYLYYAQPITFESMSRAKNEAAKFDLNIELYAATYPEDDEFVPDYFQRLPNLKASTLSEYPDIADRKLPFINEILVSLYNNCTAPYLVFTNSDIGLKASFYITVNNYINAGYDAFIITRRDNIPKVVDDKRLTAEDLELIYQQPGRTHPGNDCFVFHRNLLAQINIQDMFIGFPPWGRLLKHELEQNAKKFHVFRELHETFHMGRDRSWRAGPKNDLWVQNIRNANKIGYTYEL